ncbi:hypothetical protein [Thalassoglobus polymorphus]|uniref:Uncharacterized protein n=1 Tax=Thalassoglobus polymorphus TaxID=2527994 RepID=A0A517QTF3_9PLAN|nr:hypothetical protein [Thalassoglobus polymorphus]QDT34827.1 hypothetical protein Mal48_40990 [Thalassoglobus polymorphus]
MSDQSELKRFVDYSDSIVEFVETIIWLVEIARRDVSYADEFDGLSESAIEALNAVQPSWKSNETLRKFIVGNTCFYNSELKVEIRFYGCIRIYGTDAHDLAIQTTWEIANQFQLDCQNRGVPSSSELIDRDSPDYDDPEFRLTFEQDVERNPFDHLIDRLVNVNVLLIRERDYILSKLDYTAPSVSLKNVTVQWIAKKVHRAERTVRDSRQNWPAEINPGQKPLRYPYNRQLYDALIETWSHAVNRLPLPSSEPADTIGG